MKIQTFLRRTGLLLTASSLMFFSFTNCKKDDDDPNNSNNSGPNNNNATLTGEDWDGAGWKMTFEGDVNNGGPHIKGIMEAIELDQQTYHVTFNSDGTYASDNTGCKAEITTIINGFESTDTQNNFKGLGTGEWEIVGDTLKITEEDFNEPDIYLIEKFTSSQFNASLIKAAQSVIDSIEQNNNMDLDYIENEFQLKR